MKARTKNTFTSSCRHAQIQKLLSWEGGGGPGQMARKQPGQRFFFILVLNLFYSLQRGSNGLFTEKTLLFQGSRGGPTFFGGGGVGVLLFPGGNAYNL